MYFYLCVCIGTLELKEIRRELRMLQSTVSCLVRALGTNLGPVRAVCALYCWAIFPAPVDACLNSG
ncbi:hypothetical protein LEMLEM_LOCUS4215 [Lemmus lemmus]